MTKRLALAAVVAVAGLAAVAAVSAVVGVVLRSVQDAAAADALWGPVPDVDGMP